MIKGVTPLWFTLALTTHSLGCATDTATDNGAAPQQVATSAGGDDPQLGMNGEDTSTESGAAAAEPDRSAPGAAESEVPSSDTAQPEGIQHSAPQSTSPPLVDGPEGVGCRNCVDDDRADAGEVDDAGANAAAQCDGGPCTEPDCEELKAAFWSAKEAAGACVADTDCTQDYELPTWCDLLANEAGDIAAVVAAYSEWAAQQCSNLQGGGNCLSGEAEPTCSDGQCIYLQ